MNRPKETLLNLPDRSSVSMLFTKCTMLSLCGVYPEDQRKVRYSHVSSLSIIYTEKNELLWKRLKDLSSGQKLCVCPASCSLASYIRQILLILTSENAPKCHFRQAHRYSESEYYSIPEEIMCSPLLQVSRDSN